MATTDPRPRDPLGRFLPATRHAERAQVVDAREIRDPSAATRQVRWLGQDMPQIPEWDADAALRLGYLANVIAFRCVEVIALTGSAFPLRWGRDKPARPGDQADHDPTCRGAQLLGPPPGGPNADTAARNLIKWTLVQRLCTGRNGWEIEYAGRAGASGVVALWPLPATRLRAVPDDGGGRYWKRFEYLPADQRPVHLQRDQVVYGWTPGGEDWREPQADLAAARYPLTIAVMGDRYQHAFLKNGAVPAAIITTAEFPDDDMRQQFRAQWNDRFEGVDNAGRVAFNEAGEGDGSVGDTIDVKVLGLAQKDAQWLEIHRHQLQQVAIALGVPWSKLDASGRTFDNEKGEHRTFLLSRVVPLLQDLEDEINMQLAPRLGREVCWFDLSGVEALRPEPKWNAAQGVLLVRERIATVNEARHELGLPALDGGDELVPVPEVVVPEQPALPAGDDEPEEGDDDRAGRGGRSGGEAPADGAASQDAYDRDRGRAGVHGGVPDGPPDRRAALVERERRAHDRAEARRLLWAATDARLGGLERAWERAFTRLFARQAKATLARLQGNARSKRWIALADARSHTTTDARGRPVELRAGLEDLFPPDQWTAETREIAGDLYEVVVSNALASVAGAIQGVSFDLAAPWVVDFIDSRANQLAGQVTSTTYRQIQEALGEGVLAGEGIDELAERIRHVFDVAGSRATTIARTEVISAYNGAAVAGASSLPGDVVGGQEWIATADGRTRSAHASADGQTVAIGQPFMVGGSMMAYPGDPAGPASQTVNCRCTVGFLTPEQMAEALLPAPRITLGAARAALRLVSPESFDEGRFRAALLEAA